MKKKTATMTAVLLITAIVTATGCTKDAAQPSATPNSTNATSSNDTTPITFSMYSADPNQDWDDMQSGVGKKIKEKTGVTLKIEFPVGPSDQKVGLMASSGEYPDLVMAKGDTQKLIDAGAMLDLTPLIDKYGPNIKKVYGDYFKRLRLSNEDHAIYQLPTAQVNQKYFDSEGGFELQHQVLKELGYPKIKTLQDYENAIKAYKEKHPTIDGKPTIGLSLLADDWRILISVTNPAFYTTGAPDDGEFYIDQNTYESKYHFLRPEEKEYFRWLNHMNSIGLLDPESFVQKYDQYKAKIASGRVLGLIDQKWEYGEGENVLKKDGKFDQTYAHFPVTMNENIKDHAFQDTGYLAGNGIGITTKAKDPVRAIKFLDWLASDEGQVLVNWGIEGVDYKVENGKRVITPEAQDKKTSNPSAYKKENGIANYWLSARYGDGVKDPSGNYYNPVFPEQIQKNYTQADKDTLKAYNATTYLDLWPKPEEFPVRKYGAAWTINHPTGSDLQVTFQKSEDIMKKRIPEAILAKPENFDKVWDAFMADLDKVGVKKMGEQFTQMVKDRVKLWNE
ncbi:ABC transporter substrate-binding protein [Paenibacillus sp. V4I7]|uniref:ABC transporter substrate-binding protein n=1 Tax=Paenibacillus sp. V4I7 TaxID=3042307 RepID=UPI002786B56C|nr:ABC transporter substrate-binding protein [Paenibacillus sp. V4I7]MDQ0901871.1 putative aldouronate transport system substrate-binding protein [Paenibacillus sp. V4I7]